MPKTYNPKPQPPVQAAQITSINTQITAQTDDGQTLAVDANAKHGDFVIIHPDNSKSVVAEAEFTANYIAA